MDLESLVLRFSNPNVNKYKAPNMINSCVNINKIYVDSKVSPFDGNIYMSVIIANITANILTIGAISIIFLCLSRLE